MAEKRFYDACLSRTALELIAKFNSLDTLAEQIKVVDILHDALYDRNIRQVMATRIASDALKRMTEAEAENEVLRSENRRLRSRILDRRYTSIPRDERRELKKEVVADMLDQSRGLTIKALQEENRRLCDRLSEMGAELSELKKQSIV